MKIEQTRGKGMLSAATVSTQAANTMIRVCTLFVICGFLAGCVSESAEETFYEHPRREWPELLQKLDSQKQWKVYIYGIKTREPPPYELAVELAKESSSTMPYIVKAVRLSEDRADLNGVSAVLQMMKEVEHYDPCNDRQFSDQQTQNKLDKIADGRKYRCFSADSPRS